MSLFDRKTAEEISTKKFGKWWHSGYNRSLFELAGHFTVDAEHMLADYNMFSLKSIKNIIEDTFPDCTLVMGKGDITLNPMNTSTAPVLSRRGHCKDDGCTLNFRAMVFHIAPAGTTVYLLKQGEPAAIHAMNWQLRGSERIRVGRQLVSGITTRTELYLERYDPSNERRLASVGRIGPSRAALDKATHAIRKRESLSQDPTEAILSANEALKQTDLENGNVYVHGALRLYEAITGTMLIHTEAQLQAARFCEVYHVDATGGVLRDKDGKKYLMHALVGSKESSNSRVPVSVYATTDQTTTSLGRFLTEFGAEYKKFHGVPWSPKYVVTDNCWAQMHAICEQIIGKSLIDYLDDQFSGKEHTTKLVLCYSHMMNQIAKKVKEQTKNDEFAMNSIKVLFCRMCQCKHQNDLDSLFEKLCTVLLSQNVTPELEEIYSSNASLEELKEGDECFIDGDLDENEPERKPKNTTYRTTTKPGKYYDTLCERVFHKKMQRNDDSDLEKNPLYNTDLMKYFMDRVFPIEPVWSSKGQVLKTNEPVENFFRTVKTCFIKKSMKKQFFLLKIENVMSCKALEFLDINNLPRSRKSKVLKKENSARWCRRKKARVPIAKRCIPDISQLIKKVSRSNKVGNDDKHVPNEVKSYGVKGDNKIKSNCKKLMMASFQNDKKN